MPSPPATLHLCFGEAHEDLLSHHQIFAERRFAWPHGHAALYVIGASSIILVETPTGRLAEMIACGSARGGFGSYCETGLSLSAGSAGQIVHRSERIAYTGEIRAEELSRHSSQESCHGLWEQLQYRFPTPGRPLTQIEASELEPGRLSVRTIHEYPEHDVRVISHSRWELG